MAAIEPGFLPEVDGVAVEDEVGDGVYEGVGAVWGVGGAEVGGPGAHLVFEFGEAADVVDSSLLIQRGDGFGPDLLAMSGADGLDWQGALYRRSSVWSRHGFLRRLPLRRSGWR